VELIFGAGKLDRQVMDAEALLRDQPEKEADWGQPYLEHESVTLDGRPPPHLQALVRLVTTC